MIVFYDICECVCVCVCVCVQENWRDGYVKLCTPTSLPELKDRPQDFYDKLRSRQGERERERIRVIKSLYMYL